MFCQAIEDLRLPKPGNAIRMPWMSLIMKWALLPREGLQKEVLIKKLTLAD